MEDAGDSKSPGGDLVRVQLPLPAISPPVANRSPPSCIQFLIRDANFILKKGKEIKRIFILVFIFSLVVLVFEIKAECPSETHVTTDIIADTRWGACGSPYIIGANITVIAGVTLTIEPGVTVKFSGFYRLVVRGVLIAEGGHLHFG